MPFGDITEMDINIVYIYASVFVFGCFGISRDGQIC